MAKRDFTSQIAEIFAYWQETMAHPRARLDAARRRAVSARLREGYTVADVKQAIDGCKASPFHQGDNATGTVYDDLTLICRSGAKLEQFVGYLRAKPRRPSWSAVGRNAPAGGSTVSGSERDRNPKSTIHNPRSECPSCRGIGFIDSHPDNPGYVPNRVLLPCPECRPPDP